MHEALLEIYYKNKVTIFFITHDLEEAIFLGHKVAIMTTRPCRPKKVLEVDIPHPRDYSVLTSKRFRELMEETSDAVHEEALQGLRRPARRRAEPMAASMNRSRARVSGAARVSIVVFLVLWEIGSRLEELARPELRRRCAMLLGAFGFKTTTCRGSARCRRRRAVLQAWVARARPTPATGRAGT